MNIITLDNNHAKTFENLFVDYFREISADVPEEIVRSKLIGHILGYQQRSILWVSLAFSGDICIGFSIFQIDTEASDWCKRPGWGFLREFYIAPAYRRQGFGTRLAAHSEIMLRELGAKGLYLTADGGIPFWLARGWQKTGKICSNELEILEK